MARRMASQCATFKNCSWLSSGPNVCRATPLGTRLNASVPNAPLPIIPIDVIDLHMVLIFSDCFVITHDLVNDQPQEGPCEVLVEAFR